MNSEAGIKPLLSALRGVRQTPVPFWYMRQAGRYLPEYRKLRAEAGDFLDLCYSPDLAVEVSLQPLRRYDMDGVILFSDILVVPDALGIGLRYVEGEGPKLDALDQRDPLPVYEREKFLAHLSPVFETLKGINARAPATATVIGFAGAPWTVATYMIEGGSSRDFAKTKTWAFQNPESFQNLINLLVDSTSDYLLAQIYAGADVVQIFDSWAGVLPEIALQRWSLAPILEIVRRVRQKHPDVPVIAFPRGAGVSYAAYAESADISAVSLDSTMPLSWAAAHLQPHAVVQGNLDPLLLVCGGAPLFEEAERILTTLSGKPFVFNLGHGIVPQTPPEHVAALSEFIRGWRA
ncbi:MAG: uroporphyrinogen decarboxylase [Proteobacteria bacterium]|nr:uroporphyrinogen decarboxylase [Pseudomonadota bacterium]MDA1356221.1 uroporphyrinogen decarboxylase [Pseudomonadota bacterium]